MAFEVILDFWDAIEVAVLEVQTPRLKWTGTSLSRDVNPVSR